MSVDQRYAGYATELVQAEDIETLADLVAERYTLNFPVLVYWELLLGDGETIIDEFYGASKRGERLYRKHRMPLHAAVEPEQMGMTVYDIDVKRDVVFHAATTILEQVGVVPKAGDVIEFDGDMYEIHTARRWMESRVGKSEFYTEHELIAARAQEDRTS